MRGRVMKERVAAMGGSASDITSRLHLLQSYSSAQFSMSNQSTVTDTATGNARRWCRFYFKMHAVLMIEGHGI